MHSKAQLAAHVPCLRMRIGMCVLVSFAPRFCMNAFSLMQLSVFYFELSLSHSLPPEMLLVLCFTLHLRTVTYRRLFPVRITFSRTFDDRRHLYEITKRWATQRRWNLCAKTNPDFSRITKVSNASCLPVWCTSCSRHWLAITILQTACLRKQCRRRPPSALPSSRVVCCMKFLIRFRYCAVLVYSYNSSAFLDGTLMGNLLADYVDNGGGVVVTVFTNCNNLRNGFVKGRFLEENYHPILPARQHDTNGKRPLTLGRVLEPFHPIMAQVKNMDGGKSSFFCPGTCTHLFLYVSLSHSHRTPFRACVANCLSVALASRVFRCCLFASFLC